MYKLISHIKSLPLFWGIFLFALTVRLIYQSFGFSDYWGDAYHSMLISKLLVENDWVYSDYSGREVVWMPFYRYLVALFMCLFDNYTFLVPHVLNNIIGAFTCAISYKLIRKYSTQKVAVLSGVLLAILPWHIAYSNLNTPENLGAFLLISMLYVWSSKKWIWLVPIAFAGVLTRSEVTLLMALFGMYLLFLKDWKPAFSLLVGALIGLLIWGNWCYQNTGNFFWWITERSIGSSWDHLFQIQQGTKLGAWHSPVLSLLQALPYVLIFILYPSLLKEIWRNKKTNQNPILKPVLLIIGFDWLFIFIMQFSFYSYPEPKYYIMTLPLACLSLVLLIDLTKNSIKARVGKVLYIIGLIILLIQVPVFHYLSYPNEISKTIGKYIKMNIPEEGNLWLDYTRVWYYSNLPTDRIYSSYTLASRHERYKPDFEDKLKIRMDALDIKYIMSRPASYTYVYDIWPQMKNGKIFEWKGLMFIPVYSYHKPILNKSAAISDRIKDKIIPGGASPTIWEIKRE